MRAIASQITSLAIVYSTVYSSRRSKETSMLRVPVEFPAQRTSNAENVSIWWRHHAFSGVVLCSDVQTRMHSYASTHAWTHIYGQKVLCCNVLRNKQFTMIRILLGHGDSFKHIHHSRQMPCLWTISLLMLSCRNIHYVKWFPKLNQHRISYT